MDKELTLALHVSRVNTTPWKLMPQGINLLQPQVVLIVHCKTQHHEKYKSISQITHKSPLSMLHKRKFSHQGKQTPQS